MFSDKTIRQRLSRKPRIIPENIKTTRKKLGSKMESVDDYEWVEMKVLSIEGGQTDWAATIISEEMKAAITIELNPMQASYSVCSLKDLNDIMMYPTPYQILENLCTMFRVSPNCVVIDANKDDLLWGKVEMTMPDGRTMYQGTSAADALTFALTTGKPIYMLKGIIRRLTD